MVRFVPATASAPPRVPSVLIIGAGFGGIAAAIELQDHGIRDITILEAGPSLGGTWFYNTYPGAACDIPSQLYSYSFAQRRDWTRLCSSQPEILDYLRGVAADHGVDRLIHTDSPADTCTWSSDSAGWTVTTTDGRTFSADALIVATGQLHQPHLPELPGLDTFEGEAFHSARWDHDLSLAGKRVAVIGNGASAVQFVPEIAKQVQHLTIFQRTGNYLMPRTNRAYARPFLAAIKHVPGLQSARRRAFRLVVEQLTRAIRHPRTVGAALNLVSTGFMRWQLHGDPELRRKIWPNYPLGCKRILFTSWWLPTLRRPNVDLITDRIAEIVPKGVRTADGVVHEVDVLIYATGFRTTEFMLPMQIAGDAGQRLQEVWAEGAHAHLGMTVPGFPSMFVMYGPNTNTSGGSILIYLEAQARYIRSALELMSRSGAAAITIRPEVEAASDREVQAQFNGTAWVACNSWYRMENGRIVTNWPTYMGDYLALTKHVDPAEFTLTPAG
jgi:cation diffusion facilitator CzcD-associated flavoprotein CzcO